MNATFSDSGVFNLYVEFLNNIRNPFVRTELYFESVNGIYDMVVVNRSIDLCKFYKNRRYEPIVQVIYKLFEDYFAHWFRSCPMNRVNQKLFIDNREFIGNKFFFCLAGIVLSKKCEIECRKVAAILSRKERNV